MAHKRIITYKIYLRGEIKMKKITALVLTAFMLLPFVFSASAQEKKLTFNSDGTFRIMQINDFQDRDVPNADSVEFLNRVLDKYKPDLVVLVGDQLHDYFPGVTAEKIKVALSNQLMPLQERGIPFIFTFGNHDRDYNNILSMEEQAAFYREYSCCYANTDGADGGTYNTVIYSSDGSRPVFNIYMMDTQQWNGKGTTSGVTAEQVEWYKERSNQLKAANGGKIVPSFVFQHIPVKEIRSFLKEVPEGTEGALKSRYYDAYYVLDENADWTGDRNIMREVPGCEHPEKVTGQYEAWLEQGDVLGAYFGHDHINTFVGKTADGIELGYNGGFGFATYGDPGERYARIFDLNENDIENYTHKTLYYTECMLEPEEPVEPEAPVEPDEPAESTCTHLCHKSGFMGFVWKIVRFFWQLFRMNPVCECGEAHY